MCVLLSVHTEIEKRKRDRKGKKGKNTVSFMCSDYVVGPLPYYRCPLEPPVFDGFFGLTKALTST